MSIPQPRQIELPSEDLDAMGCFLEFLYTGDYFPKKVPGQRTLEKDASIPDVDMTGDQLLKHAKVYTLAEKFGLTDLKNLASSKIHCVNSTAKGEIAYARYVYEYTSREDAAIRVPVANFWATRSHTLRAEAEKEFRTLCLEFPQFGYDVLSMSLPSDRPWWICVADVLTFVPPLQPACSTRSSSASATRRCTLAPPAARASGPGTAARQRLEAACVMDGRERDELRWVGAAEEAGSRPEKGARARPPSPHPPHAMHGPQHKYRPTCLPRYGGCTTVDFHVCILERPGFLYLQGLCSFYNHWGGFARLDTMAWAAHGEGKALWVGLC